MLPTSNVYKYWNTLQLYMELCYKEHFPLKISIQLNDATLVNPAGVLERAAVVYRPDPRLSPTFQERHIV